MDRKEALQLVSSVEATYNTIADHFSQSRWKLWEDFIYFTPYIKDGQAILDIGCGNGRMIEFFQGKQVSYTGIDISGKLIEQAQVKYGNHSLHPQFKKGNILELTEEGKYDVIFLIAVVQHLPKPLQEEALRNVYRALKPGGVLLMTNWNMWQSKYNRLLCSNFIQKFTKKGLLKLGVPVESFGVCDVVVRYQKNADTENAMDRYLYAFTKKSISHVLKKVGFTILKNIYTDKETSTHMLKGRNILTIGRKLI